MFAKSNGKKAWRRWAVVLGALLTAILLSVFWWRSGTARREALAVVDSCQKALVKADADLLRSQVILPASLRSRTAQEQGEFLIKALTGELTPEGFQRLKGEARFGPAKELFPADSKQWANQANVSVEDCVAFRLPSESAEVVLVREGQRFRLIRCNNITRAASFKSKP